MRIRCGFEISFDCPNPTPMQLTLSVHPSRRHDLLTADVLTPSPDLEVRQYIDGFGNIVSRVLAAPGVTTFSADFLVNDSGLPDTQTPDARQHAIEDLPAEVLVYLLGSRYCETDRLSDIAWSLFGHTQPGWARVQAIVDWVHYHIRVGYEHARPTKGAFEAYQEQQGVCRDYAHLAIAFCRCMNVPARYCTGYLGDIGVVIVGEMDFSAWFEVFLGGQWHAFDARNRIPRIGRVLLGRGRDATDVPIAHHFGPAILTQFKVVAKDLVEA